jgi:8-oxo-dGTP pyrophosphatase MutT (NUDIX family)
MSFEPEKFFVGVIDFFSILMPGALVVYLYRQQIASAVLKESGFQFQKTEDWMVFLFLSYLLGHLVFLLGSWLDELYDWLRKGTPAGQSERLAEGKKFSHRRRRNLAGFLFRRNPDKAVTQAIRIESRALSVLSAQDSVNAYQWCKARLSKEHPPGLVAVQRFEADSKFFRSFAVVLLGFTLVQLLLASISLYRDRSSPKLLLAAAGLGLLILALWRYIDQRFKATQQAYWFVIALESMKGDAAVTAMPARADGLTHAGGVVYREMNGAFQYLLVQASNNPAEWVLPKGHIEPGESPQYAAVREVREETGCWARVEKWIEDVRFPSGAEIVNARFFGMELLKQDKWPPENRKHEWLLLAQALSRASHPETKRLLEGFRKSEATAKKEEKSASA